MSPKLSTIAAGGASELVKTTDKVNIVLKDLLKFRNYSLTVQAYTRIGHGPTGSTVYCHTEEDGNVIYIMGL